MSKQPKPAYKGKRCALCARIVIGDVMCTPCADTMLTENIRLRALYVARLDGAHWLDAPGHPVCRCGALSTHESGWCGACVTCTKCGGIAYGCICETPGGTLCEHCAGLHGTEPGQVPA